MDASEPARVVVSVRPLPNNLAPEDSRLEDHVEDDLEAVTGDRIAVKVERAGLLELAMALQEARSHHEQIGHHLGKAEYTVAAVDELEELGVAWVAIELLHEERAVSPDVLEGHNLCGPVESRACSEYNESVALRLHMLLDTNALFSKNDRETLPADTRRLLHTELPEEKVVATFHISSVTLQERLFQVEQRALQLNSQSSGVRVYAADLVWPTNAEIVDSAVARHEREILENFSVIDFRLDHVDWGAVIRRALRREAPFEEAQFSEADQLQEKPREKGFRDALLFEAFRQLRRETGGREDNLFGIITCDKRLVQALEEDATPDVKIFKSVSEAQSFINEVLAELNHAEAKRLQTAAAKLFALSDDELSGPLKEIKSKVQEAFAPLLNEVDPGYYKRRPESFGWDAPVFQERHGNEIRWSIEVSFDSGLYLTPFAFRYDFPLLGTATNESRHLQLLGPTGTPYRSPQQQGESVEWVSLYRKERFVVMFNTRESNDLRDLTNFEVTDVQHIETERRQPNRIIISSGVVSD